MCRNIRTLYNYEPPATDEGVSFTRIATLSVPTYVTQPAGDAHRLYVCEKRGRVRIIRDGQLLAAPLLDVSRNVSTIGERGFFSLAFAPDFARTRLYYVDYTDRHGTLLVEEFRADAARGGTLPGPGRIVL